MLKTPKTVAAVLAALFPSSEKAISEKLTQEEFNAFAGEAQEAQNRLDAQASGNEAVANDLTAVNASLKETQDKLTASEAALTTANEKIAELSPKASAWDAHKAALDGAHSGDSTNGQGKQKADSNLTDKEQAHLDDKARLKAKFPSLMADIDAPVQE